jgi:hypothetical protein
VAILEIAEEKISFQRNIAQVFLDRDLYLSLEHPVKQLEDHLDFIYSKMMTEKSIDGYFVMLDDLNAVCAKLEVENLIEGINVIFGIAGKKLHQFTLDLVEGEKGKAILSLNIEPKEMANHHYKWLEVQINQKLANKWADWKVDPAVVQSLWKRCAHYGEKVVNYPIKAREEYFNPNLKNTTRDYYIYSDAQTGDVCVLLGSIRNIEPATLLKEVVRKVEEELFNLSKNNNLSGISQILREHIEKEIAGAFAGPLGIGCSMPYTFLAANFRNSPPVVQGVHPLLPMLALNSLARNTDIPASDSSRIEFEKEDVKKSLSELARARFIRKRDERLVVHDDVKFNGFQSARNFPDYFISALDVSKSGLMEKKSKNRDFKTMFIGLSQENLEKYVDYYNSFKVNLNKLISSAKGDKPYMLNFQFYPLSTNLAKPRIKNDFKYELEHSKLCNLLIKEMTTLKGAENNPNWYSKNLVPEIPVDEIKKSLSMLENSGFVEWDSVNKRYIQTKKDIVADMPGYLQGTEFHGDVIDLMIGSRPWETDQDGDYVSTMFSASEDERKDIQKLYDEFLNNIFKLSGQNTKVDVIFQLSLQLFSILK